MSIRVMSQVWENPDLSATDKIVMLSLADHADDEGRCYPSIRRLEARTGLKERAIQNALNRLQDGGYLSIEMNAGPRGTNLYTVIPTPAPDAPPHDAHPASDAPRTKCTPAPDAPTPRTRCTPTPAPDAPEPSVTINEPSVPPKSPVAILSAIVRPDTARDFAAHRKAMRKPLTVEAARRLVKKLTDHPDPDAVFDLSIENGWQGVFPEKINGGPHAQSQRHSRTDPALDAIAVAARMRRSPGASGH